MPHLYGIRNHRPNRKDDIEDRTVNKYKENIFMNKLWKCEEAYLVDSYENSIHAFKHEINLIPNIKK